MRKKREIVMSANHGDYTDVLKQRFLTGMDIFINILILLNCVASGLMTIQSVMVQCGEQLHAFCNVSVIVFWIEMVLRIVLEGRDFWKRGNVGWNLFDLFVVIVTTMSVSTSFASFRVFRLLREFRTLRLISSMKQLKFITRSLLVSLPKLAWSSVYFALVYYLYAVLGTSYYGNHFPNLFGDMGKSVFTLFQVMTLESWSTGVARIVMDQFPHSWIYFVSFIVITAYILLNLVVGLMVNSVQEKETAHAHEKNQSELEEEFEKLKTQMEVLEDLINKQKQ